MAIPIWTQANGTFYRYDSTTGSVISSATPIKEGLNQSERHDDWPSKAGVYDVGGEWGAYEWSKVGFLTLPKIFTSGSWRGGQFTVNPSYFSIGRAGQAAATLAIASRQSDARANGPALIKRANPESPAFDAATAVGEVITGGLPAIVGHNAWRERAKALRKVPKPDRKKRPKTYAEEYLNYQFGVLPFINDIMDFSRTVQKSNEIISQYTRNSGKRQRRRSNLPTVSNSQTSTRFESPGNWAWPTDGKTFNSAAGATGDRYYTSSEEMWFSGSFKYHIPDAGIQRYAAKANHLLGIAPDIETIWNLAPWSWAADWFGNTGDCIANLSDLGPLATALEWGYVMSSRRETERFSVSLPTHSHGRHTLSTTLTRKYLTRAKGNPFYWNVSPGSLSPKQASILAALGITRF